MADLMAELAEVFELFAHSTPDEWMNDGPHLFTDTRQQVCCGRGHNECCGNPDVEGSVEEIGSVIDERDAPLIAACVNFLRTHHAEIAAAVRDAIPTSAWEALLPGTYYMDPPDGGDVSVYEQMRRMAKDAARYRWLRSRIAGRDHVAELVELNDEGGRLLSENDAAIDTAMRAGEGE
jgi:hypothetical protein